MRTVSFVIFIFLFCGVCEAASHLPSPSPAYGQAIWEVIMLKIRHLTDFPATDKYAKYSYWAGLANATSGLVLFLSLFAIASLSSQNTLSPLLLLAVFLLIISYLVYLVSMPCAIIFGFIALQQIKKRPDEYGGKKWAVAGLALTFLWTFISLITFLVLI